MAYPNAVFSAFAFLGFVVCAIPLPWHWESWNTGTCLFMIWTGLACLIQFINSVIWTGNAINWAPVWCDICTRFMVGSTVAIPAASLCINRRLYHIASVQAVTITRAEKRRAVIVDLCIGLGIPLLQMCVQYTVQGHRFNIYEDIGCLPFSYNIWPSYLAVHAWPVVIGLISIFYCLSSIRAFYRRQSQFNKLLALNKNLNPTRYLRLMCMASVEVLCTVPLASYFIYLNVTSPPGVQPYKGWADTHRFFSRVNQIPAILWRYDGTGELALEMTRWVVIFCAFIFFGFFGFADEARKHYRIAFQTLAKTVGYSMPSNNSGLSSSNGGKSKGMRSFSNSLPVFLRHQTNTKPNSLGSYSFNEKLSIVDAGGALADHKQDPYVLTEFSGTSSTAVSTLSPSTDDDYSLSLPEPPALARPEPALDLLTVPRHLADSTSSVRSSRHNSLDMV